MGMTIPQKYLKELEVKHGSYGDNYLDEKGAKRIWIEKLDK